LKSICCANSYYDYFRFIRVFVCRHREVWRLPFNPQDFFFGIWAILG
jgi:hypothetical protein